ncbi:hypothetical protein EUGRSUZ_F02774 [Eucalyptus grandis]|uniref:Uncharacterized protein n=2 Tax=Eucalyptus grandis TaxID=71139 RepID=A0ACC3KL67_EUCGR|nr:hypothetical protein EUGRSUZ_F02774 [Eucalyptus grandis]
MRVLLFPTRARSGMDWWRETFLYPVISRVPIVQPRISHLIPYLIGQPGQSLPTQVSLFPTRAEESPQSYS